MGHQHMLKLHMLMTALSDCSSSVIDTMLLFSAGFALHYASTKYYRSFYSVPTPDDLSLSSL